METELGGDSSESGGRFDHPQARVAGHEPRFVYRKLPDEFSGHGLIVVTGGRDAAVGLIQRFESEIGKMKPGRRRRDLISDVQSQAANRQQVGRGAEAEVDVNATFYLRNIYSIQSPSAGVINRDIYADCFVSDPARDARGSCSPLRVAHHQVIQSHGPALPLAIRKDRRSGEMPDGVLKKQLGELVPRFVETAPEYCLIENHDVWIDLGVKSQFPE